MPSPDVILSGLAAIANDWRGLAIGWLTQTPKTATAER
jgi:hypothetical protein